MAAIDRTTSLEIGNSGDPVPVSLGVDMSASRASTDIFVGKVKKIRVVFMWPVSLGAARPVGKFWVKTNGTPESAGYGLISACQTSRPNYAAEWPEVIASQPNGDGAAGKLDLDNIETSGPFVQCGYDATSGGVGVVPTCYVYPHQ